MPKTTKNADAAWKFISWATGKEYEKLVGEKLGWSRVPSGKRAVDLRDPRVQEVRERVRRHHAERDRGGRPDQPGRAAAAGAGRAVRRHPGVRRPRHEGVAGGRPRRSRAARRSRRRSPTGRSSPRKWRRSTSSPDESGSGPPRPLPGGDPMTQTLATGRSAARHKPPGVAPVRGGAKERWIRRAPLLPALIFAIIVTQIPFLVTLLPVHPALERAAPRRARGSPAWPTTATVLTDSRLRAALVNTVVHDRQRRDRLGAARPRARDPARQEVPRPGHRPHAAHHAVPGDADGGRAAVEARDLQPGVRADQRHPRRRAPTGSPSTRWSPSSPRWCGSGRRS